MRKNLKYFPVQPLLALFPDGMGDRVIGEHFGVSRTIIHRWRHNPTCAIDEYTADRYAILMGMHPLEIWPNWISLEETA